MLAALLLAPAQPAPQELCAPGLVELSGLATDGERWFAVADGGVRLEVVVLDPADCAVLDVITGRGDPFDVEDLALAPDGALWLADSGDNNLVRDTVALHRLEPGGGVALYRLTYPDGPHDAEALLLDRAGVPYLVTKDVLGGSGIYRPAGPLTEPGPTPLERVGTVTVGPTDTPGGPIGRTGSTVVTGGAVSANGTVVALRTYTDAYLWSAPDRDVVAALGRDPVRVPLPGEPQGEAVALAPDGALLSASEGGASVRRVTAAAALLAPPPPSPPPPDRADTAEPEPDRAPARWQAGLLAVGVAAVLVLLLRRLR